MILENFSKLHQIHVAGAIELLPRIPLIPNITDTEANITAIAGFLKNLGVTKARQLAYNPLWHSKKDKIGEEDPYAADAAMNTWIDKDKEQHCRRIFVLSGIEV